MAVLCWRRECSSREYPWSGRAHRYSQVSALCDVMIYTAHDTQAGHTRQSVGKIATMNEVKSSQQVVMISKKVVDVC